jgi:hypothetical protein
MGRDSKTPLPIPKNPTSKRGCTQRGVCQFVTPHRAGQTAGLNKIKGFPEFLKIMACRREMSMSKKKKPETTSLIPQESIEGKILFLRGKKVMPDRDLAELYGVGTKVLNQAVKRNIKRFPDDFMFQLDKLETKELVTNCDRFTSMKHSSVNPYAFTEQGVAMLSSVLNSERAIMVNIQIMRVFVHIKEMVLPNSDLKRKVDVLEKKYEKHDQEFKVVFDAIRQLLEPPLKPKKRIGF